MTDNARVVIAHVMDAHGVKGQIKLRPLTDFPERFASMKELSLFRGDLPVGSYAVKAIRVVPAQGCLFVTLEGVDDRDRALALKGCTVEIAPEERMPLEEGEFWLSDLIGMDVKDQEGNALGRVKDVLDTGASDLLEIVDSQGKRHLVPLVDDFFMGADDGVVTLRLIDGLWDL